MVKDLILETVRRVILAEESKPVFPMEKLIMFRKESNLDDAWRMVQNDPQTHRNAQWYSIIGEVVLPHIQWLQYANGNLLDDRDFCAEFNLFGKILRAHNVISKSHYPAFKVISNKGQCFYVDTQGYNYARYVGFSFRQGKISMKNVPQRIPTPIDVQKFLSSEEHLDRGYEF